MKGATYTEAEREDILLTASNLANAIARGDDPVYIAQLARIAAAAKEEN
jgi:hypothetical protein